MFKSGFADLQSELYTLEKNDFAILKGENERLVTEVERVKLRVKEEINKLQGSVRLDMNLEKGRIWEEGQEQETKVLQTSNKIDTEISALRGQLVTLKSDLFKYLVGKRILCSCGSFSLHFFFKPSQTPLPFLLFPPKAWSCLWYLWWQWSTV